MTDVLVFCGTGLFAVFVITILREFRRENTIYILLTLCIISFLYLLPKLNESIQFIRDISVYLEESYTNGILRILAITYLTGTSCEICKSAGEASVSGYIELAGKIEILLLCIPMFRELAELAFFI
jgi:stage III sporulation protein AD